MVIKVKNKYLHVFLLFLLFFLGFVKPPEENILGIITPISFVLFILLLLDFVRTYLLKSKRKNEKKT